MNYPTYINNPYGQYFNQPMQQPMPQTTMQQPMPQTTMQQPMSQTAIQQPITQQSMQQPVQQIQNGGFVMVPNEDEIKRYAVAPGNLVTFRVENKPIIVEKSLGYSQFENPKYKRYRLVEEEENEVVEEKPDIAEEISELKDTVSDMQETIESIKDKYKSQINGLNDKISGFNEKVIDIEDAINNIKNQTKKTPVKARKEVEDE